jgi:hypothetical protein
MISSEVFRYLPSKPGNDTRTTQAERTRLEPLGGHEIPDDSILVASELQFVTKRKWR